jgi:thiol-disulfide isomerase/thioredoxin
MKNFYALIFSLLLATGLSAQLADGTQMPDVTLTDINGNTHRLKDYLDSGKVVILDIFATWCGPCWFLHTNHVLADLHAQYGPDGTDQLVIFSIEGDATTSHDNLLGIGPINETQGDWVTGVEYNIVENTTIPATFGLSYWPTMYIIRPSGAMLLANDFFFQNIADPTFDYVYDAAFRDANDAALTATYSTTYFCGAYQQGSFIARLQNMGTDTLTSALVELFINGELARTKDWTGSLTEFKTANVNMTGLSITESSDLELRVSSPNAMPDLVTSDNTYTWEVIEPSAHQTAKLVITTDFWPTEISWNIKDANGTTIVSSAALGTLACDQTYEQEFPVTADGCYTVTIADQYGDGLLNGPVNPASHSCTSTPNGQASNAMGAISILLDGNVVFDNISYGYGTTIPFDFTMGTAVEDITDINSLNVYPNPVSDELTIELNAERSTEVTMTIVDMMGRILVNEGTKTFPAGHNNLKIDVSGLVQGTYFLQFLQQDAIKISKFDKM